MRRRILDVNGELVPILDDESSIIISVDGVDEGVEVDEETFKKIRKDHKNYEIDKESNTIKEKPKKEKE